VFQPQKPVQASIRKTNRWILRKELMVVNHKNRL
jgi:hypothetical protein